MTKRITKIFAFAITIVVACAGSMFAQSEGTSRVVRAHPFEPKEELVYAAEFSRALLKNVDVAEFRFTADRQDKTREPLLVFTGEVFSKGFFSRLFNLRFREVMESEVDRSSFNVQKTRRTDEQGKRKRVSEAVYENGRVEWIERDPDNPNNKRTEDATFKGQIHDILSAIYFLRTQPLALGKTLELNISDSGQVYKIPVKVVEKKRMKTILGRVEVLRVNPELFGPGRLIEKEKGEFSIWITDDARHIPVSARVKTDYGTFEIKLKRIVNPDQDSSKKAHNE